jgi:hypothetical protein
MVYVLMVRGAGAIAVVHFFLESAARHMTAGPSSPPAACGSLVSTVRSPGATAWGVLAVSHHGVPGQRRTYRVFQSRRICWRRWSVVSRRWGPRCGDVQ